MSEQNSMELSGAECQKFADFERWAIAAGHPENMFEGFMAQGDWAYYDPSANLMCNAWFGALAADDAMRQAAHLNAAQSHGCDFPLCQSKAEQDAIAEVQSLVGELRDYAANPGYSHNDYAETMLSAADTIELQHAMSALAAGDARQNSNDDAMDLLTQKAKYFDEWIRKTEWVQERLSSFPTSALGKHRADVMREEIERLRADVAYFDAQNGGAA